MVTQTRKDFICKWAACVITLAGAVCNSTVIVPLNIYLCLLGSSLYLYWSWRIREWNLIFINAFLVVIYAVGAARQLI